MAKIFLLPAVIWLLIFTIFPLLYSLRISFFQIRLGQIWQFIGIKNYIEVLKDIRFWDSIQFTFLFVFMSVGIQFFLGLSLALLMNNLGKIARWLKTIWILPIFSTPIATAYLAVTIFNEDIGPINTLLNTFFGLKVSWIAGSLAAPVSVMLLDIWQWLPFMFLVFFSGIQSLPHEPFEAASVDGATSWQIFRYLTFPLLKPIAITLIFLRMTHAFQVFDFSFGLTGGGPGLVTETTSLYIYRSAFKRFNLGYATSKSYVFFIIVIIITMVVLRLLRKNWQEENR